MNLVIDEGSRQVRRFVCQCCNADADRTWANIYDGDVGHDQFDDHVTFGCRVGPVVNSPTPAATLVNGGEVAPDSPIFGHKLSREEGLSHPRLAGFWQVVDTILEHDELVRRHVYGPGAHGGE